MIMILSMSMTRRCTYRHCTSGSFGTNWQWFGLLTVCRPYGRSMTRSSRMTGAHLLVNLGMPTCSSWRCMTRSTIREIHDQIITWWCVAGLALHSNMTLGEIPVYEQLYVCRVTMCMLPVSDGVTIALKKWSCACLQALALPGYLSRIYRADFGGLYFFSKIS